MKNEQMDLPLVSIIIPYFNHGSYINETIQSIIPQNYPNLEVIVVDDCSTEINPESALKLKVEFPIYFFKTFENSGPSVTRNLALKAAKGKYILPLDGDDMLYEPFLIQAVSEMESNAEIQVVYGNGKKFGASNNDLIVPSFSFFNFLNYNPLFVTALIRKSALESTGYYDEYLSKLGLEDWDLWLSFGEKEFLFKKIDRFFLKIRVLETSRTFQVANKNLEPILEYIYKKHWKLLLKDQKFLLAANIDLQKSREYTLGKLILKPFRILYSKFKN